MKYSLFIALSFLMSACGVGPQHTPPTIALTFDVYSTTYTVAYPIMKKYGLVGTFFNDPAYIDDRKLPDYATSEQLHELKDNGWSIQGYTSVDMIKLINAEGPRAALAKLIDVKSGMHRLGFTIETIAPASRNWDYRLRELSQSIYTNVRANKAVGKWQSYPIPDALNVQHGATVSLNGSDTFDSLGAQLDSLEASGGMWAAVIHKVGDESDPQMSVPADVFEAFCARIAADVAAGKLRAATFEEALR